jgi:hypothetical protein
MTLRFLAGQFFAIIAIAFASISFRLARPARMKWKPRTVGVAFERPKQQLANPHEGERVRSERSIDCVRKRTSPTWRS